MSKKEKIIVDISDNEKSKVVSSSRKKKVKHFHNSIIEWLLYMIGYTIVLITVSLLFKSFHISNEYYGLYPFIAAIIIYILNQTVRPILFYLTLPLTAVSMGLFYPFINVIILYLTSFLLGDKFRLNNVFVAFIIAILISFLNILMEGMIIKPIINKRKSNNV